MLIACWIPKATNTHSVYAFTLQQWLQERASVLLHTHIACMVLSVFGATFINLLNPTGYVMHQQFNIQQLYVLPTLYLCVLYLSEN